MAAHRIIGWVLFLIAFAILTSCSSSGSGESDPAMVTVSGRVVDSRGDPVSGATVTIDGVPTATPTDENGEFSAEVEPGDHELTITKGPDTIAAIPISVPEGGPGDLGDIAPTTSYFPWYEDNDGDGFGNATVIVNDENQPIDYVINDDDCDDTAAAVYPGATEVCDGLDNNCNVEIDEGVLLAFYQDADTDGYGNQSAESLSCSAPVGYVSDSSDCDDTNVAVNPIAPEVCDGLDNNCNVEIDEGVLELFFADADNDTYGNAQSSISACSAPSGYVLDDSDCDDSAAEINPGATEICNSVDDNCDAVVDEGLLSTFYRDSDVDGFGNWLVSQQSCSAPGGYVSDDTDCDDNASAIYPGAQEICNDIDDNCNLQVDEGVKETFFADRDGDLYGNPDESIASCDIPDSYTVDNTDCDDTNVQLNPETAWYTDGDGDTYPLNANPVVQCEAPAGGGIAGFLVTAFDCNDADPSINPGCLEILGNGIDDDCNIGTSDDRALFSHTDLAGTWKYFAMNAGDYANGEWYGWMEGQVVFDEAGLIQDFSLVYDDGSIEKTSDISLVIVSAEGSITTPDDPTLHGAMSQDKDTIVATYSDSDGGVTMFILHKALVGATAADFAGNWAAHGLLAGDEPSWNGWLRGTTSIDPAGVETFSFDRSDNDWEAGLIQNEIGTDGILETLWHRRSVSADQQLVVGSLTYSGGFGLQVLSQTGGAFAPGNLEGDWSFNVLSAGDAPQVNAWHYGTIEFDSAGFGETKSLYSSDPSVPFPIETLSVDAAGQIISTMDPGFSGALTINKDTIVATYTDDSGAANLFVALRRDPPPLDIVAEEIGSTMSAISPSVGGSIQATSSTGTVFQLDIPPDAIDSDIDVQVKMTPLAAVDNLVDVSSYLGAVSLAPEGLRFGEPARLTVTLPFGVPVTDLLSYYFEGAGTAFSFVPVYAPEGVTSTDTFSMDIRHFSGGGGGSGPVPNPPTNVLIPFGSQEHYGSWIASIVQQEGVHALSEFIADDLRIIESLEATFEAWLINHVHVLTAKAEAEKTLESVREAAEALLEWKAAFEQIGAKYWIWGAPCICPPDNWAANTDLVFPDEVLDIANRLAAVALREIERLNQGCQATCDSQNPPNCERLNPCTTGREVLTLLRPWLKFYNWWIQLAGIEGVEGETLLFDDQCGGLPSELAGSVVFEPHGAFLSITEEARFQVLMRDMTSSQEFLRPVYQATDPGVISLSSSQADNRPSILTVTGENAGQSFVKILEPLGCPAGELYISVEASGPWYIDVKGRASDNCHFEEAPDFEPIPDILNPGLVNLTVGPYLIGEDRHFTLDWQDNVSFLNMSGDSRNTPFNNEIRIGGNQLDISGTIGYQQNCDLEFGYTTLKGTCEFRRYEVTFPSADICQGKYQIKGRKF